MNFLTIDVFLILFIGMGPVKALLVYLAATKDASPELQRKVARKAILTATVVGILLLVAGAVFMKILHFSQGALTVAGGLILLLLALNIVLSPAKKEEHGAAPDEAALMSMAIYPLGIPLLLNPIGIVALTVFSAESQTLVDLAVLLGMLLVVAVLDLAHLCRRPPAGQVPDPRAHPGPGKAAGHPAGRAGGAAHSQWAGRCGGVDAVGGH